VRDQEARSRLQELGNDKVVVFTGAGAPTGSIGPSVPTKIPCEVAAVPSRT
jgi:hypothetical protein